MCRQTTGGANQLHSLVCRATSHIRPRFVNPSSCLFANTGAAIQGHSLTKGHLATSGRQPQDTAKLLGMITRHDIAEALSQEGEPADPAAKTEPEAEGSG